MLCLLFQIGNERYALEAKHAVEVIPFLQLRRVAQAPRGVAGIFNYRGRPVVAVDLRELTLGQPARERLSTRIILVRYTSADDREQLVGLIAEHATEMMRRDERDFVDSGIRAGSAPYLGPVIMDEKGVIQLVRAQFLLAENLRDLLFAAQESSHDAH